MRRQKRIKRIGILTAGGDCPGLNAAIRGVGKAVLGRYGIEAHRHSRRLSRLDREPHASAGHDVAVRHPHRRRHDPRHQPRQAAPRSSVDGPIRDMRGRSSAELPEERSRRRGLHRRGRHAEERVPAAREGLTVITLPKTIDNDVAMTDASFGFDTALGIATEAIDRLHSTAHSHHRIIVVEMMGHRAGWLTLGAGIAGGADVILIPEIPYDVTQVAKAIRRGASAAPTSASSPSPKARCRANTRLGFRAGQGAQSQGAERERAAQARRRAGRTRSAARRQHLAPVAPSWRS